MSNDAIATAVPAVIVDFSLAEDFHPTDAAAPLLKMAEALSVIAGELLARRHITANSQVLPCILNSSQLLEQAATLIRDGGQSRIAQPQILGPAGGLGPRRMN